MKIELIESLKTGHDGIDEDHARIVDAINALWDAMEGEVSPCAPALLDGFMELCEEHFRNEEKILAAANYPDLGEHIKFHDTMLDRATAAKQRCVASGDGQTRISCLEEMITVLIEDVVRGDMGFVSFLTDRGLAHNRRWD
ncbi:bacteriohemerythrin [Pseudomonadota bacterium]